MPTTLSNIAAIINTIDTTEGSSAGLQHAAALKLLAASRMLAGIESDLNQATKEQHSLHLATVARQQLDLGSEAYAATARLVSNPPAHWDNMTRTGRVAGMLRKAQYHRDKAAERITQIRQIVSSTPDARRVLLRQKIQAFEA